MSEERVRILRCLGAVRDPALALRALEFFLSAKVRSQDTVTGVLSVSMNPLHSSLAWKFFKDKFSIFFDRYGRGGFMIMRLVKTLGSQFYDDQHLLDFSAFFDEHPIPAATRAVKQALETVCNSCVSILFCCWLS